MEDIFEFRYADTGLTMPEDSYFDNVDFKSGGRVHNWKKYVPDNFESNWDNLSLREKKIIYFMAELQANREEWD